MAAVITSRVYSVLGYYQILHERGSILVERKKGVCSPFLLDDFVSLFEESWTGVLKRIIYSASLQSKRERYFDSWIPSSSRRLCCNAS
jgi:hypothetical protein